MIPITQHSCCCPQERAIENHKRELREEVWPDPEYQAAEAEFLRENPECHYCGRPSEVAHHDNPNDYKDKESYRNLRENGTPACHQCHTMYRRGFEICPVCLAKGEYRYMVRGSGECSLHKPLPLRQPLDKPPFSTVFLRQRNTCDWREKDQKCISPQNHTGRKCERKPEDQPGCDWFLERKRRLSAKCHVSTTDPSKIKTECVMKPNDERMAELSAGVQKIFSDAVKSTPTPSIRMEPEKTVTCTQNSGFSVCCVTQHNTTSTVLLEEKRREEKRKLPQETKGLGARSIPLTRGMAALVDEEDYERISQFKWSAQKNCNTFYAKRNTPATNGKRQGIELMHRRILAPPRGMEVDHINGNGLDNRRKNLRVVTRQQNSQNRHQIKTSRFPGVYWHDRDQKWRSQIRIHGKRKFLGSFTDEKAAYCKYCEAVKSLEGGVGFGN
jgi:hypothetical protein